MRIALAISLALGLLLSLCLNPADARRRGAHRVGSGGIASVLPADWKLLPREPNWTGKRLASPDGRAWLAVYEAPARDSIAAYMDTVARVEGERITYLKRGSSWIVVSGYKGDRIFYRKAMLACANTRWHNIAFEYPAAEKLDYDAFVTRTSRALAAHRNDGCGQDIAGR
jgi:serine/threonine-protein kinase